MSTMQSTVALVLVTALATSATPTLDNRQFPPAGNGAMSTYTGSRCGALLAKDARVTTSCTVLDPPVDSVIFHGATDASSFGWPFERK